ncbi:MAG: hypothetical protein KDN04_22595 [Verrucomicrobiae bacterium]|nr:hypothetical protein [Verrucomicrobiae bacterium]
MSPETMLFADVECPFCGDEGGRGFYICDDQSTIVLMCDECHSPWLNPKEVTGTNALRAAPPDWKIQELGCGIGEGSRWATREEIEKAGFADLIAGESETL